MMAFIVCGLMRFWQVVGPVGFEPTAQGLKGPCSATELRSRAMRYARKRTTRSIARRPPRRKSSDQAHGIAGAVID